LIISQVKHDIKLKVLRLLTKFDRYKAEYCANTLKYYWSDISVNTKPIEILR